MQIDGVIQVNGVELHVDIDVSDETKHIYVTNVAPNTLCLPPERLQLAWLNFTDDTLAWLSQHDVGTLADLVDRQGDLKIGNMAPEVFKEVDTLLRHLRSAGLVFDWKLHTVASHIRISGEVPRTLAETPAMGWARTVPSAEVDALLQGPLEAVEVLNDRHRRSLYTREVTTIGELAALGDDGLLMIPEFDFQKVEQVKRWLSAKGIAFGQTPAAGGPLDLEPTETREFLRAQGIRPAMAEGSVD